MDSHVCLGIRLQIPFWCSFRDPSTSNVHRSFPVPPPSTVYGMIAAALGLRSDDYSRRKNMRFAIAIDEAGETVESYSKWMKAAEGTPKDEKQRLGWDSMRKRGVLAPDEAAWISTPLIRQKVVQPSYVVGVLCDRSTALEIEQALADPFFPLYLGENDDMVDLEILGLEKPVESNGLATGAVSGVFGGGTLANLPTRFVQATKGKWTVDRWLVTIPTPGAPIQVTSSELLACHGHTWCFEPPAT